MTNQTENYHRPLRKSVYTAMNNYDILSTVRMCALHEVIDGQVIRAGVSVT